MPENNPPNQSGQPESTFERLKKKIFSVNITLGEFFLLISFLVGVIVTLTLTYRNMEAKVQKIEQEIEKQSKEYKLATESMQQLLGQFDKRLDQVQNDINLLKK